MVQSKKIIILGLESSCDETAASIIADEAGKHKILAENVASQIAEHQPYGGVVPEIAARAHVKIFPELICKTLNTAGVKLNEISAISATTGPGLIGGLLVGSMIGRSLAFRHGLPFYGIHHLEGHILTPRLVNPRFSFPYLVLLASGGHTMMMIAHKLGKYEVLGRSRDDALGEAFDKSAITMGLGYPGGPMIEKLAKDGDDSAFSLPSPFVGAREKTDRLSCDFSFSGLKTAVSRHWNKIPEEQRDNSKADLSASLQKAIGKVLLDRLQNALGKFRATYPNHTGSIPIAFVGGVSANRFLYQKLEDFCHNNQATLASVPLKWCTDNASMIAWAALERYLAKYPPKEEYNATRPRWSLEDLSYV